jgi:hypothetical protein
MKSKAVVSKPLEQRLPEWVGLTAIFLDRS